LSSAQEISNSFVSSNDSLFLSISSTFSQTEEFSFKQKLKDIGDDIPAEVNERQEDVDILTEQLDNLHVEPWETGEIIHKPNEKCKISTLSDKKHGTSESENFCLKENSSVCEKVDEIDRNNESFDDTNEFEISLQCLLFSFCDLQYKQK
jgi:hypothetical protein